MSLAWWLTASDKFSYLVHCLSLEKRNDKSLLKGNAIIVFKTLSSGTLALFEQSKGGTIMLTCITSRLFVFSRTFYLPHTHKFKPKPLNALSVYFFFLLAEIAFLATGLGFFFMSEEIGKAV